MLCLCLTKLSWAHMYWLCCVCLTLYISVGYLHFVEVGVYSMLHSNFLSVRSSTQWPTNSFCIWFLIAISRLLTGKRTYLTCNCSTSACQKVTWLVGGENGGLCRLMLTQESPQHIRKDTVCVWLPLTSTGTLPSSREWEFDVTGTCNPLRGRRKQVN